MIDTLHATLATQLNANRRERVRNSRRLILADRALCDLLNHPRPSPAGRARVLRIVDEALAETRAG